MKSFITFLFVILLTFPTYADFKSPEEVSKWLTHYYEHKDISLALNALEYMSKSGMLAHKKSHPSTIGFLAGIFDENQNKTTDISNKLMSIKKFPKEIIINGLWYSKSSGAKKTVLKLTEKYQELKKNYNSISEDKNISVLKLSLENKPQVIDILWGYFMATGNEQAVLKVIKAIKWSDAKDDIDKLIIGVAANQSLTANAIQHAKVLEICKAQINKQPKQISDKLKEIVKIAKEEIKIRKNLKSKHIKK